MKITVNRKKLVLALIRDDLINTKLVTTLSSLGLCAEPYYLDTSTTIMNLMKIKASASRWEKIHDSYLEQTRRVMQVDIQKDPEALHRLAAEIYLSLKREQVKNRQ